MIGGSRTVPLLAILATTLLLLAPGAAALEIATKGIKAQPSAEYSPNTAWELGYYGCGVTVAVFDNGVDDKHPYLDGKVVAGLDTTATGAMWTMANGGNPQPLAGTHGTPVAGIAVSHAGQPFFAPEDAPDYPEDARVGVAPCAWMVDVQFSDVASDDDFTTDVLQAFQWAIDHVDDDWGDDDPSNDGIDIITMSWSPNDETDGTHPICQAANEAVDAGIVVLGSAGNSGSVEAPDLGCPTGADGAISVANIWNQRTIDRSDDEIQPSSTWGPRTDDGDNDTYEELKPDIAAPGHLVVSTGASLADGTEFQLVCFGPEETTVPTPVGGIQAPFQCEQSFGGTSAATPMTAGVVALMLDANPELTPAEVKEILHQTAIPWDDQEPDNATTSAKWHHQLAYGQIDAYAAVKMALEWPGMDLGADTDADGVRNVVDAAPFNALIRDVVVPEELEPAGEGVDTDGDGVIDTEDLDPLDPRVQDEALDTQSTEQPDETPGLAGWIVLGLVGAVAALRRR